MTRAAERKSPHAEQKKAAEPELRRRIYALRCEGVAVAAICRRLGVGTARVQSLYRDELLARANGGGK